MGGGRVRAADAVDPVVGFTELAMVGDTIDGEQPLGFVHGRTEQQIMQASQALIDAYRLGDARDVRDSDVILETVRE